MVTLNKLSDAALVKATALTKTQMSETVGGKPVCYLRCEPSSPVIELDYCSSDLSLKFCGDMNAGDCYCVMPEF